MLKIFNRQKHTEAQVVKPVQQSAGLQWKRQDEHDWVAYPDREWQRYTIVSTVNGYSAKLTGYRFFLTLGTHQTLRAAMSACETDNRKRA